MHKETYTILSLLKDGAIESTKLFLDLWESGYCARHSYFRRIRGEPLFEARKHNTNQEEKRKLARNYYECIRRLERDGLISKLKEDKKRYIVITREGLSVLKENKTNGSRSTLTNHKQIKTQESVLVIFDIPEKFRKKRNWLRIVLQELDFHVIQKSVWMGKNIIPRDFIDELKEMKILPYIHFFKVEKMGTLEERQVTKIK